MKKIPYLLILFLVAVIPMFPVGSLYAMEDFSTTHIVHEYVVEYNIKRSGRIDAYIELEFSPIRNTSIIRMPIPYGVGQSIAVNSFLRAEKDADGNIINGIGVRQNTPLTESSDIASYYVSDTGDSVVIFMNAAIPAGELRVLQISFSLYQSTNRYKDVSVFNHQILPDSFTAKIEKLGVIYTIESPIMEDEYQQVLLFEENSLPQQDSILVSKTAKDFLSKIYYKNMFPKDTQAEYYFYGENIPGSTEMRAKFVMPSVWLSRLRSEAMNYRNTLYADYENYLSNKLHHYTFRTYAYIASILFMAMVAFVWLFLYLKRRYIKLSRVVSTQLLEHAKALPAGVVAYLENKQLNARAILCIILELSGKRFVDMEEMKILRRNELLLPDVCSLAPYEIVTLHWIWDLMAGADDLDLQEFDAILSGREQSDLFYMNRIRTLLDVYCSERGLQKMPGERRINRIYLSVSAFYVISSAILCWLGDFIFPLWLLVPAVISIILAFTTAKDTEKGDTMELALQVYEKELRNIDLLGIPEETMLSRLDRDFVHAVALGCSREYLQRLRYVISIDALLESRFLSRYGFQKISHVVQKVHKQRGYIGAKQLQMIYLYMHKNVTNNINEIQKAIIKDRLRPVSERLTDIEY